MNKNLEKRHITEFSDIPPSPEAVFDPKNPPHLRSRFMQKWVESPNEIPDEQKKNIEIHLGLCEKCKNQAEEIRIKIKGSLPF